MSVMTTVGKPARHVEIWGHLEENNRFLRRVAGASVAWAFLALAAGVYGIGIGLYRPVAYFVDTDGHASFVGRLRQQGAAPSEPEVRYVAREFLARYIALNSLTIDSDYRQAWAMMTEALRKEHVTMLAQYEKEHGEGLVSFVHRQNIETTLDLDAKRIEIGEHNGKLFTVKVHGTARTFSLSRAERDAPTTEKEFESTLVLLRCPRTEEAPNGLLVHKIGTRFFVDKEQAP
jgi:hypothetical protein